MEWQQFCCSLLVRRFVVGEETRDFASLGFELHTENVIVCDGKENIGEICMYRNGAIMGLHIHRFCQFLHTFYILVREKIGEKNI